MNPAFGCLVFRSSPCGIISQKLKIPNQTVDLCKCKRMSCYKWLYQISCLGLKLLCSWELSLVPDDLHPLLCVHGQVGCVDAWNVAVFDLKIEKPAISTCSQKQWDLKSEHLKSENIWNSDISVTIVHSDVQTSQSCKSPMFANIPPLILSSCKHIVINWS